MIKFNGRNKCFQEYKKAVEDKKKQMQKQEIDES
jgi:hypothetical protein